MRNYNNQALCCWIFVGSISTGGTLLLPMRPSQVPIRPSKYFLQPYWLYLKSSRLPLTLSQYHYSVFLETPEQFTDQVSYQNAIYKHRKDYHNQYTHIEHENWTYYHDQYNSWGTVRIQWSVCKIDFRKNFFSTKAIQRIYKQVFLRIMLLE